MSGDEGIVNKVAQSGLINLDLQSLRPNGVRYFIDIKEQLWQGIALKEKEFRSWVKEHDWNQYREGHVAVGCSEDAIIPSWAYMLIASKLQGIAQTIIFGGLEQLETQLFKEAIRSMDMEAYEDGRVLVKGCGEGVPQSAYLYLTQRLQPTVKSLMFGEACSSVPVYKAPRKPQ